MNPFQDPTRPESGPMPMDEDVQRQWAAIEEAQKQAQVPWWSDIVLGMIVLALGAAAGAVLWVWGGS